MSIALTVHKREIFGKKLNQLYRNGMVVGNVFGRGKESIAVQVEYETMRKVAADAGKNHAIELTVEGQKDSDLLVLIQDIDFHPVTGRIRHVEFHMVNRNEKVEAEVPVELIGTAPAVLAGHMVVTINDTVMVEANPTSLPDHLEADAETLKEPEDIILAGSLKLPAGVELVSEADTPLFKAEVTKDQIAEADAIATETADQNAADVPSDHGTDETTEAVTEEASNKKE